MTSNDPILESDLNAYVDDQLDVGRRIEVEAYLSENPVVAAQVMADLRVRDELRLALAGPPRGAPAGTREAARLLESARFPAAASSQSSGAPRSCSSSVPAGPPMPVIGPFGATEVVASTPPPPSWKRPCARIKTTLICAMR
jgi:anti-sigma factor RsiW